MKRHRLSGRYVYMLARRSVPRRNQTTRLTCQLCGSSIDLVGNHKRTVKPCIKIGCDGVMTRYRQHPEAFQPSVVHVVDKDVTGKPIRIRYNTYEEYLASSLWKRIRSQVVNRDSGLCRLCKGDGQEVHHLSYARHVMEGRDLDSLVLLCADCHKSLEFDANGKKQTVRQAASMYWSLASTEENASTDEQRQMPQNRQTALTLT